MRRLLLILSFFAFVATSLQAQVRIQFRSGEEPIPNLGIQVTACSQAKGYTSDSVGCILVALPADCSQLHLQFQDITYGTLDTVCQVAQTDALLIQLQEEARDIDEVRVGGYYSNIKETALGREYKINGEKYLPNTLIPTGLQRLPNFIKSGDDVIIEGKSTSPTYYLDGKEVPTQIIQTLDIQLVDRVEVREVSADPSKVGGEVWIYRKEVKDSFLTGTIGGEVNMPLNYNQLGYGSMPSLGFQSPRFEVNAAGSYRAFASLLQKDYEYRRTGLADSISKTEGKQQQHQASGTLQMSYDFTQQFTAQCVGYFDLMNLNTRTTSKLDRDYSNRLGMRELEAGGALMLGYTYNNAQFSLTGEYDYGRNASSLWEYGRDYILKQTEQNLAAEFQGLHQDLFTLWQVNHNLIYSYRYIARNSVTDGTLDPRSTAQRLTLQDYLILPFEVTLVVGCALDYDRYDYGEKQLSMWHPVPTAALDFGGEWGRLALYYDYRIRKPTVGHLDPRIRYKDRREGTLGNPSLRPAKNTTYTARYTKRFATQSLSLTMTYEDESDFIALMYTTDDFVSRFYNVGRQYALAPRVSYSGFFFDYSLFVNLYAGVNVLHAELYPKYQALSRGKVQNGWSPVANLRLEYQFAERYRIEAWYGHWGRSYTLYSYTEPVGDLGLQVEARFLESRALKVYAAANDLLSASFKSTYRRELYDFREMSTTFRSPRIMVGISYNFGHTFESRLSDPRINIDDQMNKLK